MVPTFLSVWVFKMLTVATLIIAVGDMQGSWLTLVINYNSEEPPPLYRSMSTFLYFVRHIVLQILCLLIFRKLHLALSRIFPVASMPFLGNSARQIEKCVTTFSSLTFCHIPLQAKVYSSKGAFSNYGSDFFFSSSNLAIGAKVSLIDGFHLCHRTKRKGR